MSKSNTAPPAIFQVLKKSSSGNSGDGDDDRATLIPSFGSSFNLSGDSAVLKKNSVPRSGWSKRKNRRHHSHGGSRDSESSRVSHQTFSSSQTSGLSSTSRCSGNSSNVSFKKHDSMPETPRSVSSDPERKYKRQNTDPSHGYSQESHHDAYFVGGEYDSSDNSFSTDKVIQGLEIPFDKLPSEKANGYLDNVPESGESIRSSKSNKSLMSNARSETSAKSRNTSSRSFKSSARRKKLRREERVREWERKRIRRRFWGKVILTVVSVLLGAYTLLVTVGPLFLHFAIDPADWCPFYLDDGVHDFSHIEGATDNIQDTAEQAHRRRSLKTSGDIHSIMHENSAESNEDEETQKYENPDYDDTPCRHERLPQLLYLTLEECDLSRRMASSVIFGGFIGYERRASDRPAGIRTMALVALGSCFFTLSSQLAFRDSPMGWDSSRVSAAIPSGVGFLGAGLIWKGTLSDSNGVEVHQVHGITTAASVWLAAAVGVGAGGALYAVTAYSTALVILVLRFGPRLYFQHDRGFDYEDEEDEYEDEVNGDGDDSLDGDIGGIPSKESMPKAPHHNHGGSGLRHRSSNYEMRHLGESPQKGYAAKGYGSTNAHTEEDIVVQLLQEDQRRQVERLNKTHSVLDSYDSQSTSWLSKLLPWKWERAQPENPYHALLRDRDLLRLMNKKKSMNKMNSRPSFCT